MPISSDNPRPAARRCFAALLLAAVLPASAVLAQPPAPTPAGFTWMNEFADWLEFALEEAVPPEPVDLPQDPDRALGRVAGELALLRQEVQTLQDTVYTIQQSLDLFVGGLLSSLQTENSELRAEVERLAAALSASGQILIPAVPRPGTANIRDFLAEVAANQPTARPAASPHAAEAAPPAPAPLPAAEFSYEVIAEWGRTPEQAAELGGRVSSLVGMVVLVPPGSAQADLENLGRELRQRFDNYDNINIEVFDHAEAAQSYAETNVASAPGHRVLSVSKFADTGRDVILLVDGESSIEVPVNPGPAPEGEQERSLLKILEERRQ